MSFPAPSWQRVRFTVCGTGGASEQLMPKAGKMQSTPPGAHPHPWPRAGKPGSCKAQGPEEGNQNCGEVEAALPLTGVGTPAQRYLCWGSVRGLQARRSGRGGRRTGLVCAGCPDLSPSDRGGTCMFPWCQALDVTVLGPLTSLVRGRPCVQLPLEQKPLLIRSHQSLVQNARTGWRRGVGSYTGQAIKILETLWCSSWLSHSRYHLTPELGNMFHSHLTVPLSKVLSLAR